MESGLKFYKNSISEKFRKIGKRERKRHAITISECIFLAHHSADYQRGPVSIHFRVGDKAKFLNRPVLIKQIMLDENQNVIYRVEYENGVQTSVEQALLEGENHSKNVVQDRKIISDRRVMTPRVTKESYVKKDSSFISKRTQMDNPVDEILKTSSEKEYPSLDNRIQMGDSIDEILKTPVNVKAVEVVFDNFTVDSFLRKKKFSKKSEVTLEELLEFLNLDKIRGDLDKFYTILTVYKFLVQNSEYDDVILEEEDLESYTKDDNDIFKRTRTISLAFQALLLKVGVKSQIAVLQDLKTGGIHNTLLVPFKSSYYFFDVEKERNLIKEGKEELIPFFSMAGLGMEDYNSNYEFLGILPQNGTNRLLPIPNVVAQNRVLSMVIKGFSREIPDLAYSKKEKVI